jgi:hypothetical protein
MIVIYDLTDNYIQKITDPEMANITGGKSDYFPDVNLAFVSIVQLNVFANSTSNYADVNIKL